MQVCSSIALMLEAGEKGPSQLLPLLTMIDKKANHVLNN